MKAQETAMVKFILGVMVGAALAFFMVVLASPAHGRPCCYYGHMRVCPCE